jgi:hypothetical protein
MLTESITKFDFRVAAVSPGSRPIPFWPFNWVADPPRDETGVNQYRPPAS